MKAYPIGPLLTALTSNQDLQKEIDALQVQMQSLQPGSPEYRYDQLHLEMEEEAQKIRNENPNLNPLNPDDNATLNEIIAKDPVYQRICYQLHEITEEYASEVANWGIPWYFTKMVPTH